MLGKPHFSPGLQMCHFAFVSHLCAQERGDPLAFRGTWVRGILCFPHLLLGERGLGQEMEGIWKPSSISSSPAALLILCSPAGVSSVTSEEPAHTLQRGGNSPAPGGAGDASVQQNQSSSQRPLSLLPSQLRLFLMPSALGPLAAASLAEGFGYSCAVHIWGRMKTAALAACLLSVLF